MMRTVGKEVQIFNENFLSCDDVIHEFSGAFMGRIGAMEIMRLTTPLDTVEVGPYSGGMEVHFSREQEAQLSRVASHAGMDAQDFVKDAALQRLEQDARFRAGVKKGLDAAARGEFIEEEEMDARVARMIRT
jgi:predicted transcriptional regulator